MVTRFYFRFEATVGSGNITDGNRVKQLQFLVSFQFSLLKIALLINGI